MSWPMVMLGELVNIKTGKLDANASSDNGQYPFFTCAREPLKIDSYSYDCDAILIAGNGDLNVKHYKGKFDAYQRTYILTVKDDTKICSRFLYYFMETYVDILREQCIGGVIKYIKLGMLTEAPIPLPPLEAQKQIVAVLEKADQFRKDCLQMEHELNQLAQAVFIEIFGDPVTNPKGWPIYSLSELGVIKGGLQVTSKRASNPIEVPYLRVANVYRNCLKLDEIKNIRVTQNELDRARLANGDILFVEGHGNANEVGRSSVWDGSIENCVHQNHLIRFRADSKILPRFVSEFANSSSGRRQLLSMSKTTSGLNTLSASNIASLQILVPPVEMQEEYLNRVKLIEKQRLNNAQVLEQSEYYFQSLMQKAFTGELILKVA